MQLLSLTGVGVEAQRVFEELSYNSGHDYRTAAVVFFAITFALWVVAAWIGASAVMKENPGAGAAVQTGFQWMSGFLLANGRWVMVKSGWYGDLRERAFLRNVHQGSCETFTTVLGPNYDANHHDHFHLDLARHGRDGTYRVCK